MSHTWRYSSKSLSPEPAGHDDSSPPHSIGKPLPLMADEGNQTVGLELSGADETLASPKVALTSNSINGFGKVMRTDRTVGKQAETEPSPRRHGIMMDQGTSPDRRPFAASTVLGNGEAENDHRPHPSQVGEGVAHQLHAQHASPVQQPQQDLYGSTPPHQHAQSIRSDMPVQDDDDLQAMGRREQVEAFVDQLPPEVFQVHNLYHELDHARLVDNDNPYRHDSVAIQELEAAAAAAYAQHLDVAHSSAHGSLMDGDFLRQLSAEPGVNELDNNEKVPTAEGEAGHVHDPDYGDDVRSHSPLDEQIPQSETEEVESQEDSEDAQDFGDMSEHYVYPDSRTFQSVNPEDDEESDQRSHISYEEDDNESGEEGGHLYENEDFGYQAGADWKYRVDEDEESEEGYEDEMQDQPPPSRRTQEPEIIDLLSSDEEDEQTAPPHSTHQPHPTSMQDQMRAGHTSQPEAHESEDSDSEEGDHESDLDGLSRPRILRERSETHASSNASSEQDSKEDVRSERVGVVEDILAAQQYLHTTHAPPVLEGLSQALRGFEAGATRPLQRPASQLSDEEDSAFGKTASKAELASASGLEKLEDETIQTTTEVVDEESGQYIISQHAAVEPAPPSRIDTYNFDGVHDQAPRENTFPQLPAEDREIVEPFGDGLKIDEATVSTQTLLFINGQLPTPNDTQMNQNSIPQSLSETEGGVSGDYTVHHSAEHLTSEVLVLKDAHQDVYRRVETLELTENGGRITSKDKEVEREEIVMRAAVNPTDASDPSRTEEESLTNRITLQPLEESEGMGIIQHVEVEAENTSPVPDGSPVERIPVVELPSMRKLSADSATEDAAGIEKQLGEELNILNHVEKLSSGEVDFEKLSQAEHPRKEMITIPTSPRRTRHGTRLDKTPEESESELESVPLQLATPKRNARPTSISVHDRSPSIIADTQGTPQGHDASIELAESTFESPVKYDLRRPPVADIKIRLLRMLRSELSDFTTVKALRYHLGQKLDILAIATTTPAEPQRTKARQYVISFNITDQTTAPSHVVEVQIFRPFKTALPLIKTGDGILLRNFQVVSIKGKGFGLRSDQHEACSWAVFKSDSDEVETRGPPVEYGEGERRYITELCAWYSALDATALAKLTKANEK